MAKRAFTMMMAGMDDAIAYANGDTSRGKAAAPLDVAVIRKRTGRNADRTADIASGT